MIAQFENICRTTPRCALFLNDDGTQIVNTGTSEGVRKSWEVRQRAVQNHLDAHRKVSAIKNYPKKKLELGKADKLAWESVSAYRTSPSTGAYRHAHQITQLVHDHANQSGDNYAQETVQSMKVAQNALEAHKLRMEYNESPV
jgi:hypothetical protein